MGRRAEALLEVCSLSLVIVLAAWIFEAYLSWILLWDWCFKSLIILVALLAAVLPGRSLRAYGFLPRRPRFTLKWSMLTAATFVVPAAVSVALSTLLGIGRSVGLSPPRAALVVLWYVVFVGLAEEAYFRGYVQTRLEESFGKRWRRFVFKGWRVDYGPGMLVASVVFAAVHIVNYWNPLVPRWEPAWWMPIHILGAFAFGCLAGALREASGDVYVPSSLHGGLMVAYALLSAYTNIVVLNAALFVAWFIFFYAISDSFFREARVYGVEQSSAVI